MTRERVWQETCRFFLFYLPTVVSGHKNDIASPVGNFRFSNIAELPMLVIAWLSLLNFKRQPGTLRRWRGASLLPNKLLNWVLAAELQRWRRKSPLMVRISYFPFPPCTSLPIVIFPTTSEIFVIKMSYLFHVEIFLAQQFLSKHEPIQGILAPSLHPW